VLYLVNSYCVITDYYQFYFNVTKKKIWYLESRCASPPSQLIIISIRFHPLNNKKKKKKRKKNKRETFYVSLSAL